MNQHTFSAPKIRAFTFILLEQKNLSARLASALNPMCPDVCKENTNQKSLGLFTIQKVVAQRTLKKKLGIKTCLSIVICPGIVPSNHNELLIFIVCFKSPIVSHLDTISDALHWLSPESFSQDWIVEVPCATNDFGEVTQIEGVVHLWKFWRTFFAPPESVSTCYPDGSVPLSSIPACISLSWFNWKEDLRKRFQTSSLMKGTQTRNLKQHHGMLTQKFIEFKIYVLYCCMHSCN